MTTTTASSTSGAAILSVVTARGFEVAKGRARCSGRRGGRRAHTHVREGGLVATVGERLRGGRHRNVLGYLVGELESILRHVAHGLQRIERSIRGHGLAGRNHSHIDILLVSGLNLLLLLLQKLNLLLDSQLFHCEESIHVSI